MACRGGATLLSRHSKGFRGFTLAEVLITLGIIGVVAAMTIPTLISNYQERVLVQSAKKAYAQLTNAVGLARAEKGYGNNTAIFNPSNTSLETAKDLSKFYKVQEFCSANDGKCGGTYSYKYAKAYSTDGETYLGGTIGGNPRFLSMDGILFQVQQYDSCRRTVSNLVTDENGDIALDENKNPITVEKIATYCAEVVIDTNGVKLPNQVGRDIFKVRIYENTIGCGLGSFEGYLEYVIQNNRLYYDNINYIVGGAIEK